MQTIMIEAMWEKEIILSDDFLSYVKEQSYKSVALFASVQFLRLDTVKKQLSEIGVAVKTTKAKRTHVEGQILGCDAYHDSFSEPIIQETDATLYVGDGMFHPKALLLSQIFSGTIRPVLIWNPVTEKKQIITIADIQKQVNKMRANLMKYLTARSVGILVTVKPGQQYLRNAMQLKEHLELLGKKAYIFIDDDIQLSLLENYPFIDSWVNTACPRIGTDDLTTIESTLINLREAFEPAHYLEKLYVKK